jgi:hypothetical protein
MGLTIYSNYEKHCGNVYNETYGYHNINIQKYHTPSTIMSKEGELLREPTAEDISPLFTFIEKLREHMIKLIQLEVEKGMIRLCSDKSDDGNGKLYVKTLEFTSTPLQYTIKNNTNGRITDIQNPMLRLKLANKDGLIFKPSDFGDNSIDELKQKNIALTKTNIEELIPKRTLVRPVCKIGDIRAMDKGFMPSIYVNGLAIKRQVSNTSPNLVDDDEADADQFGRMSLEDS